MLASELFFVHNLLAGIALCLPFVVFLTTWAKKMILPLPEINTKTKLLITLWRIRPLISKVGMMKISRTMHVGQITELRLKAMLTMPGFFICFHTGHIAVVFFNHSAHTFETFCKGGAFYGAVAEYDALSLVAAVAYAEVAHTVGKL